MRTFKVAAMLLVAACVCALSAAAVEPGPLGFAGRWRLDMARTKANRAETTASILEIQQSGQEIRVTSFNGERLLGTDVFITDGKDHKWYVSRIEKVYSRAELKKGALLIRKYSVLDLFGYQSYTETDRWIVSPDGQTLTAELSDGNRLVYERESVPVATADSSQVTDHR
jgi:hypothetical protein